MSIQELRTKIKSLVGDDDTFTILLCAAVAVLAFGLGRLSVGEMEADLLPAAISIIEASPEVVPASTTPSTAAVQAADPSTPIPGGYVASRSGAKYHLPWCSGAQRIKEENKIWFATKEEAEAAGYTPAANCKGM